MSAKVQRVRAKFYRQVLPKKGATKTTATKWRHKSTCSASAKKLTCRSKKLRAGTYRVVVQSKARKSSYRRSAPPTVVGVK